VTVIFPFLQAMKGSEIVDMIDGKLRKRDNPKMWPLPPNSPLTGIVITSILPMDFVRAETPGLLYLVISIVMLFLAVLYYNLGLCYLQTTCKLLVFAILTLNKTFCKEQINIYC